MPQLQIALLGSPEIRLDGKEVRTDRRKAVALLAYLAATGQSHPRERLAALLWPDYPAESALAYLRRTVWEINQMLGKGWLDAEREAVGLAPHGDLWLDAAAFEAALTKRGNGAASLAEAVRLYRGDFLEGFSLPDTAPYEAWQSEQAAYYRREFAQALEWLGDALAEAGDYGGALAHARRWLALDSLNEAAHRAIMRLLAAQGDRAGAIRQYESCVQILKAELGVDPQPETTELYESIRQGAALAGARERGGPPAKEPRPPAKDEPLAAVRLPVLPTPFIGRRREVEQVKALASAPEHRLVTLVGPGGTGKTRLSIQAASETAALFPDGVYFASLALAPAGEGVIPVMAKALDLAFLREEESPRQQLLDFLREKRLLLILDNFEHLQSEAALVADILAHAPGVKLLVTSRVRLNLQGEQLYPVSGMRTPDRAEAQAWADPAAQAQPFSAVQLFLDRARRVQPNFVLTRENAGPVLEICRLVQGMPLALELAAAWLALLPPEEIAAEIARGLDFLETEQADVPDRQRSLRAVFETSWKLLSETEREAFQRLCVFAGSFSRAVAEHVSGAGLRTLLALADKSWLQPVEGGRYQLHEVLRHYGTEQLRADAAAWRAARDRHAGYFAGFVSEQFRRMQGPEQAAAARAMDEEFDTNVRVAWDWLVAERRWADLNESMYQGLVEYAQIRWRNADLIPWLRPVRLGLAAHATDEERLAYAILALLEIFCEEATQIKDADPVGRLASLWQMVRAHDLLPAMGFWAVLLLGLVRVRNLDPDTSELLEAAIDQVRSEGNPWLVGISLIIESNRWALFSLDDAKLLEAEEIFRQLDAPFERGLVAEQLGRQAAQQRRPLREVARYFEQANQFYAQLGDRAPITGSSNFLAGIYLQQGEVDLAMELFHTEQRALERAGNTRLLGHSLHWESLHAARYSTYEHALQTRQRSLELATRVGVRSDVAWQTFELGEVYRIFGLAALAVEQFALARLAFTQMNLINGLGFDRRAQGDLALQAGQYAEALEHYTAYLAYAQEDNHLWSIAQAQGKLALVNAYLENWEAARRYMQTALAAVRGWAEYDLALLSLLAAPLLLVQAGESVKAVELAAFIAHHPAAWNEVRTQANALRDLAARGLPAVEVQRASTRGRALELEAVIQEQLA